MDHDHEIIICRCEEITKGEIIQAIREGAQTIDEVKRRTRGGMGLCQGRTCEHLIRRLIIEETGKKPCDVTPGHFRPPTEPTLLGKIGGEEDEASIR